MRKAGVTADQAGAWCRCAPLAKVITASSSAFARRIVTCRLTHIAI